jgi:hypothetical protein
MLSKVYTSLLKITLLTYLTILKMEAAGSSETPVIFDVQHGVIYLSAEKILLDI